MWDRILLSFNLVQTWHRVPEPLDSAWKGLPHQPGLHLGRLLPLTPEHP